MFSVHLGVSQNYGYLFGGPHDKDHSILGSILGPSILGNYHLRQDPTKSFGLATQHLTGWVAVQELELSHRNIGV